MRGEARHIGQALVDVGQIGIQPRQHHCSHPPVGFTAVYLDRRSTEHLFTKLGFIFRQLGQKRRRGGAPIAAMRQRLPQFKYARTVFVERDLHLCMHRPLGYIGRHKRVAITVPANPRTKADKAGHADRGCAVRFHAVMLAQRFLKKGIRFGYGIEQAFTHVIQAIAHFVAHFEFGRAQFIRTPHHLDFGSQLGFQFVLVIHAQAGAVQLITKQEHPAHALHHRAAARFSGVCGKYGRIMQAVDHLLQRVHRNTLPLEFGQGAIKGAFPQRHAVRQHAATVAVRETFFRHIDQFEVTGEGPHHQLHLVGGHGVDHFHQFGAALLVFLLLQFGKAATQGFHSLEYFFASKLQQHLAEQGAEQFDLRAQVVICQ